MASNAFTVYITGTSVYWPSEDSDDYVDEHGWISPGWNRTALYDDRADVAPAYVGKSVEDAAAVIGEWLGACDGVSNAPTFYGTYEHAPSDDALGRTWTYAAHVEGISEAKLAKLTARLAAL